MNWSIIRLEVKPSYNNLQDVVVLVNWMLTASNNGVTETIEGITVVDPPGEVFVAYENLTQNEIFDWVWNKISKTGTEELLTQRIQDKITPLTVNKPLPWN